MEPEAPRVWERINSRWEVCLTLSDGVFSQVRCYRREAAFAMEFGKS